MDENELDGRMRVAASHIPVPEQSFRRRPTGWGARAGAIAVTAAVLAGTVVLGQQLAQWRQTQVAASPSSAVSSAPASPTRSVLPAPTVTPPAVTPPLVVVYDSPVLGYRLQFPDGFRRSDCLSSGAAPDGRIGGETFTLLSPQQERASELAHIARGGEVAMWTFQVTVFRADGLSALELARRGGCPRCDPATTTQPGYQLQAIVLGGYEAARVVINGEVRQVVVQANERLYVLELYFDENLSGLRPRPPVLTADVLSAVALTFQARPVGSLPAPTPDPTIAPPGAQDAAVKLAGALQSGAVDELGGLLTPQCWLIVSAPNSAPTGRVTQAYNAELRDRFAAGLRITVVPTVQVAQTPGPGGGRFFMRSEWTEAGRTVRADLYLREIDGRWYWAGLELSPPGP
jgi:hypothetical protein